MLASQTVFESGKAYIDASNPPPDGDGDRLAHIGFRTGLNPLNRLSPEKEGLQDALPFFRRTGATTSSQLTNPVVPYCGA
jgi:hypothetical protein